MSLRLEAGNFVTYIRPTALRLEAGNLLHMENKGIHFGETLVFISENGRVI